MIKKLILLTLLLASIGVFGAPLEFDTSDGKAHVIVSRPIDSWSGNKTEQERALKENQDRSYDFQFADDSGKYVAPVSKGLFGTTVSELPVLIEVKRLLDEDQAVKSRGVTLFIDKSKTFTPERFDRLLKSQSFLYKLNVIDQGDPRTLTDRVSNKKLVGNLLALGTLAIGVDKFGGTNGFNIVNGSGLPDDLNNVVSANKSFVIPTQYTPSFNPSEFASVDVRRTRRTDTLGQIIIAYREEKTPATETEALSKAIVYTLAVDTPLSEIKAAKEADYNARLAIWDECVAQGQCK